MDRVVVIDDDYTTTTMVKTILTKSGYNVNAFNYPEKFLAEYKPGLVDIILSDINMPGIDGMGLVHEVRKTDIGVPIVILTATSDIKSVIEFFKEGVLDYLVKPLVPEDLIFRVGRIIKNNRKQKLLYKMEVEKELVELENKKLINWKNLYATKDINQTKQMMSFFSRTINAGGGYLWLDFLKGVTANEDGMYIIKPELYDLIIASASAQKKTFEFLAYINNLPEINLSVYSLDKFKSEIFVYCSDVLEPLIKDNGHELSLNINDIGLDGSIRADLELLKDILLELTVNAIKYSKKGTKIVIEFYSKLDSEGKARKVVFKIRNIPKSEEGIPYDLTELVFDLFYTIESYIVEHKAEKWSNGTGLYISRNLVKSMDGWISCCNVNDFTKSGSGSYTEFKLQLPVVTN